MTEEEYLLEMLCCLPKELLTQRMANARNVPAWLKGIEVEDVSCALRHYNDEAYQKMREEQEKYL